MESTNNTQVINVRAYNLRKIGYQNISQWMDDPNNVYIGRGGFINIGSKRFGYKSSIWANPFKITEKDDRESVIAKYREYI